MTEVLYPIYYGTRMVTMDVLKQTFEPKMHPEAARRMFNFLDYHQGAFGIGGGWRQTNPPKPGFAPDGMSFHQYQNFPTGKYYTAWDLVCPNPGRVHRSPGWGEVPAQGSAAAHNFGVHMNVPKEPWHMQPIELDGWETWVRRGKPDLQGNYPIVVRQPPPPPVTPPPLQEIIVQFNSRVMQAGHTGSDVKYFQRIMNDVAGQGLVLDGIYGPTTIWAVTNWQKYFGLTVDGVMGAQTQQSMIEIAKLVA